MSVFGKILEKLGLQKHSDDSHATSAPGTTATRSSTTTTPSASPGAQTQQQAGTSASPSAQRQSGPTGAAGTAAQGPAAAPPPRPISEVDVAARLEQLAADNPQKLDWRTSIVDLMKLVGMESSLAERKELAAELGYPSDQMNDTARMNMWLHKQVLSRIAQNGGKVPKELLN